MIRAALAFLLGNGFFLHASGSPKQCAGRRIVSFVFEASGAIDNEKMWLQRLGAMQSLAEPEFLEAIKDGLIRPLCVA